MNLLLDTHTLIWFSGGNQKMLSAKSRSAIEDITNDKFVSIASFWEIAIKASLGKLSVKKSLSALNNFMDENGIILLPVLVEHTIQLLNLKFHHRDPFDRLLIAQAIEENFHVVTRDKNFSLYNIKTIW